MSTTITVTEYKKQLEALCTRGGFREWPRKSHEQHVLMKSAIFMLDPQREYAERELNEQLMRWCQQVGENFQIDHASLRRFLVDAGYLERDAAGHGYRLNEEPNARLFEHGVGAVDPVAVVREAQQEIEERRRRYTEGK